jgi:hypothetical protein
MLDEISKLETIRSFELPEGPESSTILGPDGQPRHKSPALFDGNSDVH